MEGTIIGKKYKIIRQLGKGGNGSVYLAEDTRVRKLWAVKQVKELNQIEREIEALRYIKHKNLPLFVDVIKEENESYLVMEYIEGNTLEEILKEKKTIPKEECVRISLEILEALKCLHNQNPTIVYGDLKPSNVMIDKEGNVKLIDFGAAFCKEKRKAAYGTLGYAAPEQVLQHLYSPGIDRRTDFYSFGVLLYKMITGEFPVDTSGTKKMNHPYLSEELKEIVLTCISFEKEKRYETEEQLSEALKKLRFLEKRKKRQKVMANAVFLILFSVSIICFVLHFRIPGQFLYPSFVFWMFSFLWYMGFCKKKEGFYKGDGIRLLLSAKKIPGLVLLICFLACFMMLQGVSVFPEVQAKAVYNMENQVPRDEYGRKILIRENKEK
ncbi:MAG: serine/threonine protein kinase [Lachnospiraceae bacterium]|nr:serine/threonine protein kinase [Lachnospiraceae bacterium]